MCVCEVIHFCFEGPLPKEMVLHWLGLTISDWKGRPSNAGFIHVSFETMFTASMQQVSKKDCCVDCIKPFA
jgi:hypothetical protein